MPKWLQDYQIIPVHDFVAFFVSENLGYPVRTYAFYFSQIPGIEIRQAYGNGIVLPVHTSEAIAYFKLAANLDNSRGQQTSPLFCYRKTGSFVKEKLAMGFQYIGYPPLAALHFFGAGEKKGSYQFAGKEMLEGV